jgi:hypothetical protein
MSCTKGGPGPNPVDGVIYPEHFRFREIVPDNDRQVISGGWRAVCIHAQIKHGNSDAKTLCKFEVGIPFRTEREGEIPLEAAQFAAAAMANRAARDVLSRAHPGEMYIVLCQDFIRTYDAMLRAKYAGSRVSTCYSKGIETVPFGYTVGKDPVP